MKGAKIPPMIFNVNDNTSTKHLFKKSKCF